MPYSRKQLERTNGFKPRPPRRWMRKMEHRIRREYPGRSKKSRDRIIVGIWHRYKPATRRRLAKKYGAGPDRRRTRRTRKKTTRGLGLW